MSVLWFVLQSILILFLSVLGLFMLLCLGVLFLPITYDIAYSKKDTSCLLIHIKLFWMIKIFYSWSQEEDFFTLSVLGKVLKKGSSKAKETQEVKETQKVKETQESTKAKAARKTIKSRKIKESQKTIKSIENTDEVIEPITQKERIKKLPKKSQNPSIEQEKSDAPTKEENKESLSLTDLVEKLKDLWQDPNRKILVRELWKMIKRILNVLKPKTLFFHLIIGKNDPAETGQLIAKLTMFYPLYASCGMISGNYTEEGVWGEVRVKGELAIKSLIKPLIVFIGQKRVRKYIYTLLKLRKED